VAIGALDWDREHLFPIPKHPIGLRPPGQDAAGHVEEHVGGIERLAGERLAGLAGIARLPYCGTGNDPPTRQPRAAARGAPNRD